MLVEKAIEVFLQSRQNFPTVFGDTVSVLTETVSSNIMRKFQQDYKKLLQLFQLTSYAFFYLKKI